MPTRPPRHLPPRIKKTEATPEQERKKEYDKQRPTRHERGYDSKWVKARAGFLKKHPLCKECDKMGMVRAATVVDHIIPHKGDKSLFWLRANWQPLCKPCHDRKTAREGRWKKKETDTPATQ